MSARDVMAVKTIKDAQAEIVQWENRIEGIKQDYANLQRSRETVTAEIDKKTQDYQAYIAGRETELRRGREQLLADQTTLESQKKEFAEILAKHNITKANLAQEKVDHEKEKNRFAGRQAMVNDFIQAVRRAYNVLPEA